MMEDGSKQGSRQWLTTSIREAVADGIDLSRYSNKSLLRCHIVGAVFGYSGFDLNFILLKAHKCVPSKGLSVTTVLLREDSSVAHMNGCEVSSKVCVSHVNTRGELSELKGEMDGSYSISDST